MPLPPLSPDERRLGALARASAALYAAAGLFFALLPDLTMRIASGGAELPFTPVARFWHVLAIAMMAMLALCCWLAAKSPRENRRLLLPVLLSKALSSAIAAGQLLAWRAPAAEAVAGKRALLAILTSDLPLLLATAWFYWRAAPGVHLDVAVSQREAEAPAAKPVALGLGKVAEGAPAADAKPQG